MNKDIYKYFDEAKDAVKKMQVVLEMIERNDMQITENEVSYVELLGQDVNDAFRGMFVTYDYEQSREKILNKSK